MNIAATFAAPATDDTRWLGTTYRIAVDSVETGSPFGTFYAWVSAGEGPPLHVHDGEDEAIHVLDGEVAFWLDGHCRTLTAGHGIFLPRGVPHTFRVVGPADARLLGLVTPGGFEGFFAEAARQQVGPHDPAALHAFADAWRLRFLGPNPLPAMAPA